MEARRGGRPSQVRPRPSSPVQRGRIRPAPPSPNRLSRHRTIERRGGLPLVAKVGLGGGIVVLGWFCLMIGLGLIGPAMSGMAHGFGSLVGSLSHLTATASPSASAALTEAPVIDPPDAATTNTASIDLTVRVPESVVGRQGYKCRLYVTLPNAAPAVVTESPIGGTSTLVLSSVALAKGANSFTARVVTPDGREGPASKPVAVTLDVTKPKISISTPKNNASVSGTTVTIKGKTQAASAVQMLNDANGATANLRSDDTGVFSAQLAVASGPNNITITVTDPAGNGNVATITVTKGTGKLKVTLIGSAYTFSPAKLPADVTFTATVIGADGKPVVGATALFTVSVPGVAAIVSAPTTTNASGDATFSTTIPKGAMPGQGVADVLITLPNGQTTTARASVSVR